jgi:hypothetical protein
MVKYNTFRKQSAAEKRAEELGCKGSHKMDKGFMPCSTHKEFEKVSKTKKPQGEIDELIDFDGTMNNSKIPPLNLGLTPRKTTDQTVAAARITADPLLRGYRVFYTESDIKEEDFSTAFGYDETKDMDAEEAIDYFVDELGFDEDKAEGRVEELGKTPELDGQKTKGAFTRMRLKEKFYTKKEMKEIIDGIVSKKSETKDIQFAPKEMSKIITRNIQTLKKLAEKDGISVNQLISMLKNEQ